jgi:hypothetical protein
VTAHKNANSSIPAAPDEKLQEHHYGKLGAQYSFHICRLIFSVFALKILFPLISNTLKIDEYQFVPKLENYNKNGLARSFCSRPIYILDYGQYLYICISTYIIYELLRIAWIFGIWQPLTAVERSLSF